MAGTKLKRQEELAGRLRSAPAEERIGLWMDSVLDVGVNDELQDYAWPLMRHLSLRSASAGHGEQQPSATFSYTVQASHCNGLGNLHGGAAASLFDVCTSLVLAPVGRAGYWMALGTSRTLGVTYLRPAPAGTRVLLECEAVHVGRRLCSLRAVMRREADGAVLATCEHGKVNTDPPAVKI